MKPFQQYAMINVRETQRRRRGGRQTGGEHRISTEESEKEVNEIKLWNSELFWLCDRLNQSYLFQVTRGSSWTTLRADQWLMSHFSRALKSAVPIGLNEHQNASHSSKKKLLIGQKNIIFIFVLFFIHKFSFMSSQFLISHIFWHKNQNIQTSKMSLEVKNIYLTSSSDFRDK